MTGRTRCGTLLLPLILAAGASGSAWSQDSAAVAWNAGDLVQAERLYAARLARDSSNQRALHRLGLIAAWSERYGLSVALFDHLQRVAPENQDAAMDRARVLSWAGRFPESIVAFKDVLAASPADLEARRGLARVVSWAGDLVAAEQEWRRALAADTNAVPSLVGLAQTLRWQGRAVAALPYLRHGRRLAPDNRDVASEWSYLAAAVAPRVAPSVAYETDSDGNRIATFAARGAWRPAPRVEVGLEGYVRTSDWTRGGLAGRAARGALASVGVELGPGWMVGGGVGLSGTNVLGADQRAQVRAAVASPGRHRVGGAVSYRRAALDATALLMERGVEMGELALSLRAEPAPGWSATASLSHASFAGTADNGRTAGFAAATRRLSRQWTAGARVRALGFSRDLNDGYFDPDLYGLVEGVVRWRREAGRWVLEAEVAPGLQRVGSDGAVQGTAQTRGGVAFATAPGREVGLSAAFSRAGLQSFATGEAGYRYLAITAQATWWF